MVVENTENRKNVLVIVCDQFRYDCIRALGNSTILTPNLDRLVERGTSFTNAYSSCPVCVAARYTIMTGREPHTTGCYANEPPKGAAELPQNIEERCGAYLARVMSARGYRTFGIGKFHTKPDCYENLGFEVHKHTEELWENTEIKKRDAYAGMIMHDHPEYAQIDQLHGERTNMYYVPQMSPLPAELTVEAVTSNLAVQELNKEDTRPYFGYVSFVGPHPPCAPPAPYHLLYDPDIMENPYRTTDENDFADEQIPWMNYAIWAEDISDGWARNIKSRYYAEITYIDSCIGQMLDVMDKKNAWENTLVIFTSDHGDHMGDHGAWQKESFFEQSCKVPFIVCTPGMKGGVKDDRLVSLCDLFGIVTSASGKIEVRDGIDILGGEAREYVYGMYGRPGTERFKLMVRGGDYKYIYISNGGREQFYDVRKDPKETENLVADDDKTARECGEDIEKVLEIFRGEAKKYCNNPGLCEALRSWRFPYHERKRQRIHQFEFSKNIDDFQVSGGNYFSSM